VLEPGAIFGECPRVFVVVRGGVFDHAVLDVAAFRRIMLGGFRDTPDLVHTHLKPTHVVGV
jgi:hypothetical protein